MNKVVEEVQGVLYEAEDSCVINAIEKLIAEVKRLEQLVCTDNRLLNIEEENKELKKENAILKLQLESNKNIKFQEGEKITFESTTCLPEPFSTTNTYTVVDENKLIELKEENEKLKKENGELVKGILDASNPNVSETYIIGKTKLKEYERLQTKLTKAENVIEAGKWFEFQMRHQYSYDPQGFEEEYPEKKKQFDKALKEWENE